VRRALSRTKPWWVNFGVAEQRVDDEPQFAQVSLHDPHILLHRAFEADRSSPELVGHHGAEVLAQLLQVNRLGDYGRTPGAQLGEAQHFFDEMQETEGAGAEPHDALLGKGVGRWLQRLGQDVGVAQDGVQRAAQLV